MPSPPLTSVRACLAAGSALMLLPQAATAHRTPPAPILAAPAASQAPTASRSRAEILRQIALAKALPPSLRRARLLALAGAVADPDGVRAAALATAFGRDAQGAQAAIARARAAPLTTAALAALTQPAPPSDDAPSPPPLRLRAASVPPPPPLADPAATLAFSRNVLARDPGNDAAQQDAVRAALQLDDAVTARQLAADAVAADPNNPAAWMLAATVAAHTRDTRLAMMDLTRARDLRQQQIGSDTGANGDGPDGMSPQPPTGSVQSADLAALQPPADAPPPAIAAPAPAETPYRTAQTIYTNPFRDQQQQIGSDQQPPPESSDPMTQQIDSTLATLQADLAPQVAAYVDVTGRSGQGGFSNLGSVSLPIEATFSPGGYGKLRLEARPTYLFAGHAGSTPLKQAQFGTLAFGVTGNTAQTLGFSGPGINNQDGKGVALDADYAWSWLEADVGTTPLGFTIQNVVGGITLTPRLTDNVGLRLIAERRAVTDSLLAYAGAIDPRTGNKLGGVTKNRVYGQVEFNAPGNGYWYAGVGGEKLYGENVEHNSELEAGAGVNYPVWSTTTDTVRVGLNLVYFGFDKNLEYFTLGQGGYFSPQHYFAALIPVSYSEKLGRLSYLVSGSVGIQTYHQDNTVFFPTNPALQAALQAKAANTPGLQTSYGSQGATGPSGNVHGEVQYEITPNFDVGGSANFQSAGNFQQGEGLVYARYIFNGVR